MATRSPYPTNKSESPYVLFPDGTQIFVNDIKTIQITAGAPLVVNVGLWAAVGDYAYTAQTAASAQNIRNLINGLKGGSISETFIEITDPAAPGTPPFTSLSDVAAVVDDDYDGTITGIGLLSLGITNIQADDGGGNTYEFEITSYTDLNIVLHMDGLPDQNSFSPAGIYTLYYSADGGSTWTITNSALQITST